MSYVSRRCRGTDSLSGGEIRGNNTGGEINEDVWGANAVPHPLPLLFLSLLYAALSLSPSLSFSVYYSNFTLSILSTLLSPSLFYFFFLLSLPYTISLCIYMYKYACMHPHSLSLSHTHANLYIHMHRECACVCACVYVLCGCLWVHF